MSDTLAAVLVLAALCAGFGALILADIAGEADAAEPAAEEAAAAPGGTPYWRAAFGALTFALVAAGLAGWLIGRSGGAVIAGV